MSGGPFGPLFSGALECPFGVWGYTGNFQIEFRNLSGKCRLLECRLSLGYAGLSQAVNEVVNGLALFTAS